MAWTETEHNAIVKTLALVCEITATEISAPAKMLMVKQLGGYGGPQIIAALERCAAELKFKLTLADIVSRIDDGRPGAEEAWATFPKSENESAIVTQEALTAWGAARSLYCGGDAIAARMAFRETYERCVRESRARGLAVRWIFSPGFDLALRESAALDGLKRGLISEAMALQYIEPTHREQALLASGREPLALTEAENV